MIFRDREEAGRLLGQRLLRYREERPVVLGLPRGGVPVAFEVAMALRAPLEVLVALKLGAPGCPEYAVGAIAEGGTVFVDPTAALETGLDGRELDALARARGAELARRVRLYRGGRPFPEVRDLTAILVDDGIATGRTARAAARALRREGPRRLVLAAPVVAVEVVEELRREVDDLVCLEAPESLGAVSAWYRRFDQTGDEEVLALLERARAALAGAEAGP